MAFTYRLLPDERLALCVGKGPMDISETIELLGELTEDDDFGAGWGILIDVRQREESPSAQDVEAFLRALSGMRDRLGGRVAFVAERLDQFGMARMLELRAELWHLPVRAFKDTDEAMEWLGRGNG